MLRRLGRVHNLTIFLLLIFIFPSITYAAPEAKPELEASPNELVDAVNALRASYGFAPYSVSSILMATAQAQADYIAATGIMSHTGAGGSSVTDRLLAAGYPLAGELSLGGFRSENITSGNESMSAQAVVEQWSGDSVHLNTMTSPDLTEIGAGISVNRDRVYFVIDCARPVDSGEPKAAGTSALNGSSIPSDSSVMIPVVVSTPNVNGETIHEVKAGQTLWQIAISYNTTIDEIKRLNALVDDNIYPGTKLLIRKNVNLTPPQPPQSSTVEVIVSSSVLPTSTVTLLSQSLTVTPTDKTSSPMDRYIEIILGILVVAVLGGSMIAWLGRQRK